MNNATLGLIWAFSFVILEAAQAVFFGGVFQDYDSFLIGSAVFGFTAAGTLIWAKVRTPEQLKIAWANGASLFWLNVSTALVWIAYFFALQMIEPAVVFTVFSGLIPITVVIASACGVAEASPLRNGVEGVGLIAVAIGVGYLAAITLLGQSGFVRSGWTAAMAGLLLTCVSAVSLAAMMIYSQRLDRLGIAPVAQYALRFPLYVMVALPAAWLGLDGKGPVDPGGLLTIVVIGFAITAYGLCDAEGYIADVHPDTGRDHGARSTVRFPVPDRRRPRGLRTGHDDGSNDLFRRGCPSGLWRGQALR